MLIYEQDDYGDNTDRTTRTIVQKIDLTDAARRITQGAVRIDGSKKTPRATGKRSHPTARGSENGATLPTFPFLSPSFLFTALIIYIYIYCRVEFEIHLSNIVFSLGDQLLLRCRAPIRAEVERRIFWLDPFETPLLTTIRMLAFIYVNKGQSYVIG